MAYYYPKNHFCLYQYCVLISMSHLFLREKTRWQNCILKYRRTFIHSDHLFIFCVSHPKSIFHYLMPHIYWRLPGSIRYRKAIKKLIERPFHVQYPIDFFSYWVQESFAKEILQNHLLRQSEALDLLCTKKSWARVNRHHLKRSFSLPKSKFSVLKMKSCVEYLIY